MRQNSRLMIIQDIENFSINLMRISCPIMKIKYNFNPVEYFDQYLDWVIGHILSTQYNIKVVGHFRHDESLCVFSESEFEIKDHFRASINIFDLSLLYGNQVKILVNGTDLFITRRVTYKHFV